MNVKAIPRQDPTEVINNYFDLLTEPNDQYGALILAACEYDEFLFPGNPETPTTEIIGQIRDVQQLAYNHDRYDSETLVLRNMKFRAMNTIMYDVVIEDVVPTDHIRPLTLKMIDVTGQLDMTGRLTGYRKAAIRSTFTPLSDSLEAHRSGRAQEVLASLPGYKIRKAARFVLEGFSQGRHIQPPAQPFTNL